MVRALPSCLLLSISICFSALAEGEPPAHFLDPSTGEIGGRVAMAIYPKLQKQDAIGEFPDPKTFFVHLISVNDPDVDLVYECGQWFQPPSGIYRFWIEGEWLMSPYSNRVSYVGKPFQGYGMTTVLPVVEAGLVALPAELRARSNLTVRLLRATDHSSDHIALPEISRRERTAEVGEGLQMPAGPVIAALWDETTNSYAAISRPFDVRHRETVRAPLERPDEGSTHLVAEMRRASPAKTVDDFGMLPVLHIGDRDLQPDVKVETRGRVYALWFDLEPGSAVLDVISDRHLLAPTTLTLRPGSIERFVGKLEESVELSVRPFE